MIRHRMERGSGVGAMVSASMAAATVVMRSPRSVSWRPGSRPVVRDRMDQQARLEQWRPGAPPRAFRFAPDQGARRKAAPFGKHRAGKDGARFAPPSTTRSPAAVAAGEESLMRALTTMAVMSGLIAVACPEKIAGENASSPPPLHIVMPGADGAAPLGWKFSATVSDHAAVMAGGQYPWVGFDDPPVSARLSYGWRGPGATMMAGYLEYEFASRPPR